MGGQLLAVDRVDGEAHACPTGRKRGIEEVARDASSPARGRRRATVACTGAGDVAADRRRGIDRGEVVGRRVAERGGRLVTEVTLVVATDVAAALGLSIHRVLLLARSGQRPDQAGGRFSVKAAIPSAWSSVSKSPKNAARSRARPSAEAALLGVEDGRLGGADRERRHRGDPGGELERGVDGRLGRDDAGDQPVRVRLVRGHRPAGQDHLHGPGLADRPRQALRAAGARHDPEPDLGLAERASSAATIMSQAIASSQPPPRAKPRTAAMSGRPMARDPIPASRNAPPAVRRRRRLRRELADVGAGRERPVARAGDDDRPAGRVAHRALRARRASSSSRAKLRALSASGRSSVTSATPGRIVAGAADAGAGAGNSTRTSDAVAPRSAGLVRGGRCRTCGLGHGAPGVSSDSIHGRGSGARPSPGRPRARGTWPAGRDLAQVPTGRPHRVGRETGVEGRPIVEVHRGDEHQVRLAAERLATRAGRASRAGPASPATSGRCSSV